MHTALRFVSGFRRLTRRLGRLAAAQREMAMLLRTDERALRDIGLTRGEAEAAASCSKMARAAAARRNEAMAAADRRRVNLDAKGRTVSGAASHHRPMAQAGQMVGLHGTGTSR